MKFSLLGLYKDVGFDLGTSTTQICFDENNVILEQPSVVARDKLTKKVLAVGQEAEEMLGRTPDNIDCVRPIKDGVVADFSASVSMIKEFLKKSFAKNRIIKPRVVVSVPQDITEVEKRAVTEVFIASGAREVLLLPESMAAAIGVGLQVGQAQGNMVVNIGAGTAEVSVISLGGIVASRSIRGAGSRMDNAICNFIKKEFGVCIGEKTAKEIKSQIGSCMPYADEGSFEVKGRAVSTGLPKNVRVTASLIRDVMNETISDIIGAVIDVLEQTPPELASDILKSGITITGGGAKIRGIDKLIEEQTGVKTTVAKDYKDCVCKGALMALKDDSVKRRIHDLSKKR